MSASWWVGSAARQVLLGVKIKSDNNTQTLPGPVLAQ